MKAKRYAVTLGVAVIVIPAVWAVVRADDGADKSVPKWALPVDGKANKGVPRWASPVDGKADKGALQTKSVPASQAEILRGLSGVHAFVGFLDAKVERLGLTKLRLQADTELQLRQHDIKAFSVQEWLKTPGGPLLFVRVEWVGEYGESSEFAVGIEVELCEDVYLARDPASHCLGAVTWQTRSVVKIDRSNLNQIRDGLRDLVARFVKDYLEANGTEGKTEGQATERGR